MTEMITQFDSRSASFELFTLNNSYLSLKSLQL